ncbi:MAG: hypothetical protein HZB22_05300 [Deltaproteobacteria bacterium]|nr:hypothetical protein [Deltaproteobacteria bacterium]
MPARWYALRYHPEQRRLWTEGRRFAVVPAGRRSGKTELAKRRLVVTLSEKKQWADPRYFAAAPTRGQAKRIFWNDIKLLTPPWWVRRVYETDMCISTVFGSEIWVVGLDKPQRIEGTPWDGGVLDEYADMKARAWSENIRPALSDRGGWCWFIGVPQGLNHFRDIVNYAQESGDCEWGLYTWSSSDILPREELEAARRVLDPRTYRQEYEASFEGATGRVYYAYSASVHEAGSIRLNPDLPIALCCDFNVDPCVWEAAQTDGRSVWVLDEIAMRNTNTREMAREALKRFGAHRPGVTVYGDAAGMSRSTAGSSDYAILHEMGLKNQRVRRSNPHVKDRVNAVNSMLMNSMDEPRLFHHPRCVEIRKDLETVEWRANGVDMDKSDPMRTHASDALGYFLEYEFPLRIHASRAGLKFYK